MAKFTLISLATCLALVLAGCGGALEERDETAGWSAQKIYNEAKSEMQDGTYEAAIKLFEKLEARYPYGRYAQQAQLDVAYSYYKSSEPVLAVAACDRFIKLHPNHPHVDYAYYLKGLIYFNEDLGLLGRFASQDLSDRDPRAARNAFDTFRELAERFPKSVYAEDARRRLQYLVNALGRHEVNVARYYLRRGAYVAAVNRAKQAVQSFPRTPAVEQALHVMVLGYDAMGMAVLRDDAKRILEKNYPGSVALDDPSARKPWWQIW
ncbi:MAG: outer membrane protein assembly factor BamD [Rhodocyclaceae bacterium]|nr:outer membrane protein assembly factor BamD [Rhodocyclaceae bacterium]